MASEEINDSVSVSKLSFHIGGHQFGFYLQRDGQDSLCMNEYDFNSQPKFVERTGQVLGCAKSL